MSKTLTERLGIRQAKQVGHAGALRIGSSRPIPILPRKVRYVNFVHFLTYANTNASLWCVANEAASRSSKQELQASSCIALAYHIVKSTADYFVAHERHG